MPLLKIHDKPMKFDIITIFPQIFDSYLNTSVLRRARERKLIQVATHDLRRFSKNKQRKVDDKPYGGGAGMVLMAEPILAAAQKISKNKKSKIVILSAKGRQFNQKMAGEWAKKFDQIVFISGRYEGIDERVKTILSRLPGKAEEISIGPYVLTDGDVAVMAIISSVARLVPGVIKPESLEEESHWNLLIRAEDRKKNGLEYPHYTRPEILIFKNKKYPVPRVLLSGNHKKINEWRKKKEG